MYLSGMVRQRVIGTQGCSQIPLTISLELAVSENSELFLHIMCGLLSSGLRDLEYHEHTDT